ncbi:MAG TPA: hypothetical protein DCR13_03315 [Gammaproteobacteria bacterium]|nr:hypothetical protein [Gammaproteobacteria bacterium]
MLLPISFTILFIALPLTSHAEILLDPTMPPNYQSNTALPFDQTKPKKWYLNSTLVSPTMTKAIINQQPVIVGDTIQGAVISHIDHDYIILQIDNKPVKLELHNTFIHRVTQAR